MRRCVLPVLIVLLLSAGLLTSAASIDGWLSGGVTTQGKGVAPYAHVRIGLSSTFSLGVEYGDERLALSGWFGESRGLWGEVLWTDDLKGAPDKAAMGVWGTMRLHEDALLRAWVGAQTIWASNRPWLTMNAELNMPMAEAFSAMAGASVTLGAEKNETRGWIGLGIDF